LTIWPRERVGLCPFYLTEYIASAKTRGHASSFRLSAFFVMEIYSSRLRMKKLARITLATAVLLAATLVHAVEVTVFAAASLADSLKEIAAAYERQSGDKIVFNFGASSTLARQIEEGAPADLFFSADEAKMDELEKKGLILKETRKSRLSNSLVIVVAAEMGAVIESPKDLATDKVKRLALAEPKSVPAGIYAKEYLQKQNLWSAVERKVIPTENVRAALAAVEAGNLEAGIVYKTDAAISKKVKVAYAVPDKDSPGISYPMAVVKEAKQAEAAKKFLQYLGSRDAAKVFERFGFIVRK
jgi:molybdate transport system substrate-binding protein